MAKFSFQEVINVFFKSLLCLGAYFILVILMSASAYHIAWESEQITENCHF